MDPQKITIEDILTIKRFYRQFAKAADSGLGDDMEKLLKKVGIEKMVKLIEFYTGTCNCPKRKADLNTRFPSVMEKVKEWIENFTTTQR